MRTDHHACTYASAELGPRGARMATPRRLAAAARLLPFCKKVAPGRPERTAQASDNLTNTGAGGGKGGVLGTGAAAPGPTCPASGGALALRHALDVKQPPNPPVQLSVLAPPSQARSAFKPLAPHPQFSRRGKVARRRARREPLPRTRPRAVSFRGHDPVRLSLRDASGGAPLLFAACKNGSWHDARGVLGLFWWGAYPHA